MNTAPLYVDRFNLLFLAMNFLSTILCLCLLRVQAFADAFFPGFELPLGMAVAYTITAANVQASAYADKDSGIAGEVITAGMPVYKNAADGNKLYKADTNQSLAASKVVGLALHGASPGQPLLYAKKDPKFVPGITLVAGDIVLAGATAAGDLAPVADLATGWFPVIVGVANSTTEMNLNITPGGIAK